MIETKFKVGEKVWYLWGRLKSSVVEEVRIINTITLAGVETEIKYFMKDEGGFVGDDNNMFKSKQGLIDHLARES